MPGITLRERLGDVVEGVVVVVEDDHQPIPANALARTGRLGTLNRGRCHGAKVEDSPAATGNLPGFAQSTAPAQSWPSVALEGVRNLDRDVVEHAHHARAGSALDARDEDRLSAVGLIGARIAWRDHAVPLTVPITLVLVPPNEKARSAIILGFEPILMNLPLPEASSLEPRRTLGIAEILPFVLVRKHAQDEARRAAVADPDPDQGLGLGLRAAASNGGGRHHALVRVLALESPTTDER